MAWKIAALFGIGMNMLGVVGLFYFGMPFRVSLGDQDIVTVTGVPSEQRRMDGIFKLFGYASLALILGGSALQAYSVVMAP